MRNPNRTVAIRAFFRMSALVAFILGFSGCGVSIELQRGESGLTERPEEERFFLVFDDGSESNPDNVDGHLNLLWTSDEKRDKVVAGQVQYLVDQLTANGFSFVNDENESTVEARLEVKSVRFDPLGGWITDDAAIEYVDTGNDEELGKVVANEGWPTPTIKSVFEALLEGSLKLWGVSSPK